MHHAPTQTITRRFKTFVSTAARTLLALSATAACAQSLSLHDGDLIFISPAAPNAITASTGHAEGISYDHVAIFHLIGGTLPYVIEATPPRVCLTQLDSLLASSPRATLARVNVPFDTTATIAAALRFVGRPYDFYFEPNDSAIYCSELVQKSFVNHNGKPLFSTIPMSFHDADGQILDYWKQRYAAKGKRVPDGEPGTNPNELISRSQITTLGSLKPTK